MYRLLLAPLLLAVTLTGCSTLEFPWVYRIDIEQGNIVTQEMIDQLKPGMTKSQVEYIMGSALLKDTFNDNRWDYIHTVRHGSDDERTRERLSVFFENDRLTRLSGNFRPSDVPGGDAPGENG